MLRPNYPATKLALSHEHDKSLAADDDSASSDDDNDDVGRYFLSSSYTFWTFCERLLHRCILVMEWNDCLRARTLTSKPAKVTPRSTNAGHKTPSILETPKHSTPLNSTRSGRKVKQANYDMRHHPMDTVVKPRIAAKHTAAREHDLGLDQSFKVRSSRAGNEPPQNIPATPGRTFKHHRQFPESGKQLSPQDTDALDDHHIDSSASPLSLKEDLGNSTILGKKKGLT